MPLNVKPEEVRSVTTRLDVDLTPDYEPTGLTDQITAAMQLDNIPVSAATRLADELEPPGLEDRPIDVLEHLTEEERFRASDFADVETAEDLRGVRARRAREEEARRAMAEGPLPEILASTIAVLTDPTSYVPVFGAVGKGGVAARMARVGALSAAEVAAAEAALQGLQETRTMEESLAAVMLGGAFGMTVGGAVAARGAARTLTPQVPPRVLESAVQDAATSMRGTFPESTVGSAQVNRIDPVNTTPETASAIRGANAVLSRIGLASPSLQGMASRFSSVRKNVLQLIDTGVVTRGAMHGIADPQAVSVKIKRHDAVFGDFNKSLDHFYKQFRRAGGRMGKTEFFEEVGRAARRGDAHADPSVQAMAKKWREMSDLYKREAETLGLLPDDVDVSTAKSYLSRVYRRDRIKARRPEFKATIVRWLGEQAPDEDVVVLRGVADDIINTILGSPDGRTQILGRIGGSSPRARGPLKERTFNIPDALIEDFLESNVQVVGNRYIRTMAADIEFARAFGEVDPSKAMKNEIRDETVRLSDEAKSERDRAKILDEGRQMEAMVEDLINQLRGVGGDMLDPRFQGTKNILRSLRNVRFGQLLGGVSISSIPDAGIIVLREGLARSLGTVFADLGRGFKGIRLAKREAQVAGTAWDYYLSTRVRHVLDLGERYEVQTKLDRMERGSQSIANFAARAFLINNWNTTMKSTTSAIVSTRILQTSRRLARGEALSKADQRRLASSGISPDMARRMADEAEQWTEVGEGGGQVLIANSHLWRDREAADAFLNALLRDVDNTILTPGVGDAPLWTSTEWGKSVFQFKKFASAATTRLLLASIQTRDMATLNGLMLMTALGAFGTALRDYVSHGEVRDRNARQWAADSIDRAGMAALYFELDALMEKGLGMSPVTELTGQEVSRFAGRDFLAQALGPTAGLIDDARETASGVLSGDLTQSDLHKVRRMVPFQNVFYARWLFDQMEEGVSRAFGLPERQPRRRPVAPSFPGS